MAQTTAQQSANTEDTEFTSREQALEEVEKFLDQGGAITPEIRDLFERAMAENDDDIDLTPEEKQKRAEAFEAWVDKHARYHNFPESAFKRENWY